MGQNRVVSDPAILSGKPTIRGTRIPVSMVLRRLAQGMDREEMRQAYPRNTDDDLTAALEYAADLAEQKDRIAAEKSRPSTPVGEVPARRARRSPNLRPPNRIGA